MFHNTFPFAELSAHEFVYTSIDFICTKDQGNSIWDLKFEPTAKTEHYFIEELDNCICVIVLDNASTKVQQLLWRLDVVGNPLSNKNYWFGMPCVST